MGKTAGRRRKHGQSFCPSASPSVLPLIHCTTSYWPLNAHREGRRKIEGGNECIMLSFCSRNAFPDRVCSIYLLLHESTIITRDASEVEAKTTFSSLVWLHLCSVGGPVSIPPPIFSIRRSPWIWNHTFFSALSSSVSFSIPISPHPSSSSSSPHLLSYGGSSPVNPPSSITAPAPLLSAHFLSHRFPVTTFIEVQ